MKIPIRERRELYAGKDRKPCIVYNIFSNPYKGNNTPKRRVYYKMWMWRAFTVNCYEYRRRSLTSRGGQIGTTLLRQTVITVILQFLYTFTFSPIIQFLASMLSKVYYAILRIQNGVFVQFSTSWAIALTPIGARNNAKIL